MTRDQAILTIRTFEGLVGHAVKTEDLGALQKAFGDYSSQLMAAGETLDQAIEGMLAEMIGGPFHALLESMWLHYKTSQMITMIGAIVEAAHREAQQPDAAAALGSILDEAIRR